MQFYELLQVIDEFVDKEKLAAEQGDVVVESKIIVDQNTDVNKVMNLVEGLIGEDGDETGEDLKITYWNGKDGSAPAEGEAAIAAMQNDLDEEDEAIPTDEGR